MSKFEKSLSEWVTLGFIDPNQAARIRDHESSKPESSWVLSGLLILGASNKDGLESSEKFSIDLSEIAFV